MKECIYSIPITDAFKKDCECPFCELQQKFEKDLIEYYLGPSVMEDDVRFETAGTGFCEKHFLQLQKGQQALPLALTLQTHMEMLIKELEDNSKTYLASESTGGFFSKFKNETQTPKNKLDKISESCIVCSTLEERMNKLFDNFFYLYKTEKDFKDMFLASKGFCLPHFVKLNSLCTQSKHISQKDLPEFKASLYNLMLANLKRVKEDIDWFIQKFDYRFSKEPWKNSKDSIKRSIQKTCGAMYPEDNK